MNDGTESVPGNDSTPIGTAPPGPRWPLYVSGLAWAGWLIFLIAMMLMVDAGRR